MQAPFTFTAMAVIGYVYGKVADLPAAQSAKAWAIWSLAEIALLHLATAFTKDRSQVKLKAAIVIASGLIGIQALYKRGLIGEKMIICVIAFRTLFGALAFLGQMSEPELETNNT